MVSALDLERNYENEFQFQLEIVPSRGEASQQIEHAEVKIGSRIDNAFKSFLGR
jgi:hypothetical protein